MKTRGPLILFAAVAVVAVAAWWWSSPSPSSHADAAGASENRPVPSAASDAEIRPSAEPGFAAVSRAPFREPEPSADESSTAAAELPALTDILLLGDDDHRLAGAETFLLKGGAVVAVEAADADGRVRFPADGDAATFVALCTGYAPFQGAITLERGTFTAKMPFAGAIAGRVTIDGVPATTDFALKFQTDRPFAGTADLPPLGEPTPRRINVAEVEIGAQGAFRLGGLESGLPGRLIWPPDYESADATSPRATPVVAPAAGLTVALRRAPMLVGRVLLADGTTPAAKVDVVVRIQWGMLAQDFPVAADAEGRYACGLAKCPSSGAAPVGVEVVVLGDDGRPRARRTLTGDFARATDAGDLLLPAVAAGRTVRVLAADGTPIGDAVVVDGEGRIFRTDAGGRVGVDAEGALIAGAVGHRRRSFMLEPDGETVVALEAVAAIEITVQTEGGKAAEGVVVAIAGRGLIPGGPPDVAYRALCKGEIESFGRIGATDRIVVRPDAEGRVFLPEATADAMLDISVADGAAADARVLDRRTVQVEHGVVRVTLTAKR